MAKKQVNKPVPGEIVEWVMLGYLAQAIETQRTITIDVWNDAIAAAARAKQETL